MNDFHAGMRVKIKDDIASELESTVGTWDNEFKGLVGLVGTIHTPLFKGGNRWLFVAESKSLVFTEDELEAVQA